MSKSSFFNISDPSQKRGSVSILMAVMIVFLMITMYFASTSYISFRAKSSRRVTEAYRLIGVFEEVGKTLRAARDTAGSPSTMNWPAANPTCATTCYALTGQVPQICVPHPIDPGAPYCFNGPDINVKNASNLDLRLMNEPGNIPPPDWSEKAIAAIDHHLRDLPPAGELADSLSPIHRAYALPPLDIIATRSETTANAPITCDPAAPAPGCITCGGPNPSGGGIVTCVTVSACPATYPGCVSGSAAGIKQTFFLVPGGYRR